MEYQEKRRGCNLDSTDCASKWEIWKTVMKMKRCFSAFKKKKVEIFNKNRQQKRGDA